MQLLFSLLIFTLPMNLFLKTGIEQAYVSGLLIDYLIPKLYLSDLILWALLLCWLLRVIKKSNWNFKRIIKLLKKLNTNSKPKINYKSCLKIFSEKQILKKDRALKLLGLLVALLLIRQFFTPRPVSAFWFSLQLLEMGLLAAFLIKQKILLVSKLSRFSFIITLFFQTLLAGWQFFMQQPLLPYRFLGEPTFRSYFQLHRQTVLGQRRMLAYGSTAHPNVLAGLGVLFYLMVLRQLNQNQHQLQKHRIYLLIKVLLLAVVLILLFFTQSISALLCLIIGILVEVTESKKYQVIKKKLLPFVTNFFLAKLRKPALLIIIFLTPILIAAAAGLSNNPSLTRRSALNQAAIKIWLRQPLQGTGLNQITIHLDKALPYRVLEGFIQPTHHVPLLLLVETGVLGLILIAILWKKIPLADKGSLVKSLLIISPILALDHYLYTLQTGQLLLTIWLVYWVRVGER